MPGSAPPYACGSFVEQLARAARRSRPGRRSSCAAARARCRRAARRARRAGARARPAGCCLLARARCALATASRRFFGVLVDVHDVVCSSAVSAHARSRLPSSFCERLEVRRAARASAAFGSCTSTVAYRSPCSSGLADGRHAVALQPEHLAVLRRRRNLQPQRLAAERRHLGLAAEHRGRQRDRHARVEVAALALELRMRREPDAQVQIAGLARRRIPCSPSPATRTREPSPTPAGIRTSTRARVAVVLDARAGASRRDTRPRATARSRARRRGPARGAAAAARAPRRRRSSPPPPPPKNVWKKSENGLLVAEHLAAFLPASSCGSRPAAAAELTFQPPAERIRAAGAPACSYARQFAPSSSYFLRFSGSPSTSYASLISLKLRLGRLVARVDVGMVLARQLPERLLDLLLGRGLRDAERRVVVLEVHTSSRSPEHRRLELDRISLEPVDAGRASRVRERVVAHQRPDPLHDLGDREQPLHAGQVDARLVDQALDQLAAARAPRANRAACCRSSASAAPARAARTSAASADASRASARPR